MKEDLPNDQDVKESKTDKELFTGNAELESDFEKRRDKYIKGDPTDTNFFSLLFYVPGFNIIRYIREGLPIPHDLGDLIEQNRIKHYSKRLLNQWNHSKGKKLIKIILEANRWPLIFILIGGLIQAGLTIGSVLISKKLIKEFKADGIVDEYEGIGFLVINFFYIFFVRKLNDYQIRRAYKMGYQLECLIYYKILYSKSLKQFVTRKKNRITSADIINYIEIDCYKLSHSILTVPSLVILPFQLVAYFYMIFDSFKVSFIYGVIIFVIFFFVNFYFMARFRHHQSQEQIGKDATMKITIKTLRDIENIKLNAEEVDYVKKIYEKKNKEMGSFSEKRLANNINSAIQWFVPNAMTVMTMFMYLYTNDNARLNSADIFTYFNIMVQINSPIRDIPATLKIGYETWVSIKRIDNFLRSSDRDEGDTYYEKNNPELIKRKIMVKIEDGFFTRGETKKGVKEDKNEDNKEKEENIIETKSINKKTEDKKKHNAEIEDPLINDTDDENSINQVDMNMSELNEGPSSKGNLEKTQVYDFLETEHAFEDPETTTTEVNLKNINLTVRKGELVLIYGKSGSGKSSLLDAILNEIQVFFTRENRYKVITSVNGTTSFSSQDPFIYDSTIRQNITLDFTENNKVNFPRYLKVVDICSLKDDIIELNKGDLTEIGENGIHVSSGQRRRIGVARCLYAKRDIYLLDLPTYNLDNITSNKIFLEGIIHFLKHKTRIVTTNKEEFARYANKIIVLKEGKIIFNGNYYDLTHNENLKKEGFDFTYKKELSVDSNTISTSTLNPEDLNPTSRVSTLLNTDGSSVGEDTYSNSVMDNEASKKKFSELVRSKTMVEKMHKYRYQKSFFLAAYPFLERKKLLVMVFLMILEWQLTNNCSYLWIVFWTLNQVQDKDQNGRYVLTYASFNLLGAFCVYFRNRFTTKSTNNFIKNLNMHMTYHLVKAPINGFYGETPSNRIINRFVYDLNNLEDNYFQCWQSIISIGVSLIIRMIFYLYFLWLSSFVIVPIAILLILLSFFYFKSARQLNRIECTLRTALLQFLGESIYGKDTIKSFDVVGDFMDEFYKHLDHLLKCRLWINLTYQWFGLILGLLSFGLDCFLIIESFSGNIGKKYGVETGAYGLLINGLFVFRDELKNFQSSLSMVQEVSVAFERSNEYNQIVPENYGGTKEDINLDDDEQLFKHGKIRFENYSFKYKPDEKNILNNINLTINGGDKIAVIGKTGGGKSTLIYALTRIIEAHSGHIYIDDIDIETLPLQILRKNIKVLSAHQGIFEGTLLSNLDPLGKYSDEEIKSVLKSLKYYFNPDENQNYGLDDHIEEGGDNLTLAEKNLMSIAKLLLCKNCSIVILDDFSSCLDEDMQKAVFEALYSTFPTSTFLIISNEIKDFMNINKVMRVKGGDINIFDNIDELLKDKNAFDDLLK